jgi:hypothetical protein
MTNNAASRVLNARRAEPAAIVTVWIPHVAATAASIGEKIARDIGATVSQESSAISACVREGLSAETEKSLTGRNAGSRVWSVLQVRSVTSASVLIPLPVETGKRITGSSAANPTFTATLKRSAGIAFARDSHLVEMEKLTPVKNAERKVSLVAA